MRLALYVSAAILFAPFASWAQSPQSASGLRTSLATPRSVRPTSADLCRKPMAAAAFDGAKQDITNVTNDPAKLTLAKRVGTGNCLSTTQVMELMDLFDFEDTRLDFSKFAYDHVVDAGNYGRVASKLRLSGSVEELDRYLQTR